MTWPRPGVSAAMTTATLRSGDSDASTGGAMTATTRSARTTIDIAASPDSVYDVWSRYENFPHFMSHVIEVRDLGNQRCIFCNDCQYQSHRCQCIGHQCGNQCKRGFNICHYGIR